MAQPGLTPEIIRQTAERLRLAQEAIDPNQTRFAERAGLPQPKFANYISRSNPRPLTIDSALKLCEEYGLSLDWLYRGNPAFMPAGLLSKIEASRPRERR